LKQTTKEERLVLWKPKISFKPGKNYVKCSHVDVPPLLCPQKFSALFVGHASTFIFATQKKRLLWFPYLQA